jgi:hypothetical protein
MVYLSDAALVRTRERRDLEQPKKASEGNSGFSDDVSKLECAIRYLRREPFHAV